MLKMEPFMSCGIFKLSRFSSFLNSRKIPVKYRNNLFLHKIFNYSFINKNTPNSNLINKYKNFKFSTLEKSDSKVNIDEMDIENKKSDLELEIYENLIKYDLTNLNNYLSPLEVLVFRYLESNNHLYRNLNIELTNLSIQLSNLVSNKQLLKSKNENESNSRKISGVEEEEKLIKNEINRINKQVTLLENDYRNYKIIENLFNEISNCVELIKEAKDLKEFSLIDPTEKEIKKFVGTIPNVINTITDDILDDNTDVRQIELILYFISKILLV
jgi:hypothetical protein